MKSIISLTLLAPLALVAPEVGSRSTQDQDQQQVQDQHGPVTSSDLVMRQFRPRNIDSGELFEAAQDTLSRSILVRDPRTQQSSQRRNMQMLGDAIIVYDLVEAADRIIKTLGQLDEQYGADEPKSRSRTYRTAEYIPSNLSLQALLNATQPYAAQLRTLDGRSQFSNISVVRERGTLVIRDDPEKVDEMLQFLARIDVARPQILLTAYLVRASDAQDDARSLPEALVESLAPLIGAEHLEREALAMLRTSVDSDRELSMLLQSKQLGDYELHLTPAAYDAAGRSLSLSNCTLVMLNSGTRLFTTQTAVSTGEYTVLGASGPSPLYLVLHAQPLSR